VKVVVCLVPWFQPIAVAQQWKVSTKMMAWLEGHGKAIGKCLVVDCFASLLKNG
jgi:hypothetical protein